MKTYTYKNGNLIEVRDTYYQTGWGTDYIFDKLGNRIDLNIHKDNDRF